MKIVTVCGMGFGTSLMVKMTIEDILQEIGKSANVEALDLGSVRSVPADLYVTSTEMEGSFPEVDQPVIFLKNMTDKSEIQERITKQLENM